MKAWKSPEMKVFSVKMDENIAASGEQEYEVKHLDYDLGGITRGGDDYRCTSDQRIQDTDVTYSVNNGEYTVPKDKISAISGCLA